jgi:hemolysin type calcium-binding protein/WD40 repeat protein
MHFNRYNGGVRRLPVFLAAPVAALFLLSAASGGSFPGTNGLIAYNCNVSGQLGVCTATQDGTVYGAPLISGASDPSWSPNGQKIAYVQINPSTSNPAIYTANADGSNPQLFEDNAYQPTWSRDNSTIAFVFNSGPNANQIWEKTTTGVAALTGATTIASDPAFSPDGTQLAYTVTSGATSNIYVKSVSDPAATLGTKITNGSGDENPSWSPTSPSIAYDDGSAIFTTSPTACCGAPLGSATGTAPTYSPDGSKIAYANGKITVASASNGQTLSAINGVVDDLPDWGQASPPQAPSTPPDTANGPKNTSYPVITLTSGDSSPVIGHGMFASQGTWSGTFPISFTYQWKRCEAADPVNGSCFNIIGATSSFYTPVHADNGFRIRVAVTASNSDGRTTQNSEVTAPTIAIAVKVRSTPAITPGPPQQTVVDTPLSLTAGVWDGSTPIAFTYSWRRCNPVGDFESCVPIVGATASTYTPTIADIGFSLRVWITGSNLAGSDTAITNHTYPVVDKPHFAPSVVSQPEIAGVPIEGRQLTANIGSYKGDSPIVTPYQWFRCDANGGACHAIPKATKVVYYATASDVGYTLRLYVFAKNAYGNLLAQSDPTLAIAAAPPHVKGRRIVGSRHGDYLAGGGHDDTVLGLGGNDTILGGAGDDRLDGGAGNDVITGGSGADTIFGGDGSDTILANDGERDVIDCGPGNDRAIVDPFDVVKNCEVSTQTAP